MYAQKAAGIKRSKNYKSKSQKSKIKRLENTRGFLFAKILFFTFIVIVIFSLATNLHKINEKKEELDSLKQQHNSQRISNDALKQKLDAPIDADYIANVVKEIGYRKSDEILFYLDSEE